MKSIILIALGITCILSCKKQSNKIEGTWKMVYAETIENDSLKIKNLSNTKFIKIINDTHFAFFNQQDGSSENFYGGAGTYVFDGFNYEETLNFTSVLVLRNHKFPFTIEIKGDSLIQTGLERIKEAGIDRRITEKYVRMD
ncbi:hypothetical protein [uncultured Algibacter sp.]|uniref:hypothetical protein n=1 Tax=uncultured Algibacter sp. TaxID=298659 RepID=UPI002631B5FB|nr:hypothetical protein [uncultured Algibacter sp.]